MRKFKELYLPGEMLIRFLPPLRMLFTIYVQTMRITEFSIQSFELHEKHEELQ